MNFIGYRSTELDPYIWFNQAVKPSGEVYYKYMLIYADDIICLSRDPKESMDALKGTYSLKDENFWTPQRNFGAIAEKVHMDNGKD